MRPAAGLLLLALVFGGCENNIERSAHLAKLAHHQHHLQAGLSITHASTDVKVVKTAVVHSSEGSAAVVMVRNISPHTLVNVPIAITVKDASGRTLFQNNARGLEARLVSISSLPAHTEATWIDDQVQLSGTPTDVSAIVGEAPVANGPVPTIEVQGVHPTEEGGSPGAAGTVRNRSGVAQQSLVVDVLALRGGSIVAAGRSVLPEVAAGASVPFQTFLVGAPEGAKLEASAVPSSLG
ncbi:MAG TPA: hypothetical protein VKG38_00635 [Solirubrobacteraceae bacterium]|nr:hypothetical protein [Solirubrobacteraceae bacterium]